MDRLLFALLPLFHGFPTVNAEGSLLVVLHDGALSPETRLSDEGKILMESVLRSVSSSFNLELLFLREEDAFVALGFHSTPQSGSSFVRFGKCESMKNVTPVVPVLSIYSRPCVRTEEEDPQSIPFHVAMESRRYQCLIPALTHWIVHPKNQVISYVWGRNVTTKGYRASYLECIGAENKENLLRALTDEDRNASSVSLPYGLLLEQGRRFLNGKSLVVVTINRPPFVILETIDNQITDANGFCVTMLDTLATKYNFTYRLVLPYDGNWGNPMKNGTFNGMVGMVNRKEVDFAVAGLTITLERQSVIDFTHAFYEEPTTILIPAPKEKDNVFAFLDPYTWEVWTAILLSIGIVSPVMWLLGSYFTFLPLLYPDADGDKRDSLLKCYADSCFSLAGQNSKTRQTIPSRVLMAMWGMAVICLSSTYTGILTAFLTVPVMESLIDSIEALANQRTILWTYRKGTAHDSLFGDASPPGAYYKIGQLIREQPKLLVNTDDEGLKVVLKKKMAFIKEKSWLDFAMEQDYLTTKQCRLSEVPQLFFSAGFGWALQEKSIYLPLFNAEILRMAQSGLFSVWKKNFWPKPNECTVGSGKTPSGPRPLTFKNLYGHFLILGFGLGIGAFIFVAEKYACRPKDRKRLRHKVLTKFDANSYGHQVSQTPLYITYTQGSKGKPTTFI